MKKYIFVVVLLLFECLHLKANHTAFAMRVHEVHRPIHIRIDFYIANPRTGCESGIGICKGTLTQGIHDETGRKVNAECYIEDNAFIMMIQRENMNDALEREIENSGYFPMYDEFDLPGEWLEEMKISASYTIPIGEYRIIDMKEYFLINFNLK